MTSIQALVHELKRRRVFRVAALYAVVAVGVIAAANDILPNLQLPVWTVTLVIALVILGLPVALVLAWAVDVTPEGIRRTPEETTSPTATPAPPGSPVEAPLPAVARSFAPERSIAVLPFTDLSPGRDNEYFSDGLTEEVIAALSKARALRVISRTSVMGFKGAARDLRAIARELGVRYVLEGSVRKAGERLRVTAQLVEAEGDTHLWAETYDGTIEDVFGIQQRLSTAIVEALRVQLAPATEPATPPPVDPRIRDAYLRAWHELWNLAGPESLDRALQIARNALDLFGEHELLLVAAGTACWQRVNGGTRPTAEFPELLGRAREYAERALVLNPQSSPARVLLGEVYNNLAHPVEATLEFHRAVRLDPSNPDAAGWLAFELGCGGLEQDAGRVARHALAIDPLRSLAPWCAALGALMAGRVEDAVALVRRTSALETGPLWLRTEPLGLVLLYAGRREEAASVLAPLLHRERPSIYECVYGFTLEAMLGNGEAALSHLSPEVLAGSRWDDFEAWVLADGYAALGEPEEALRWWDRAVDLGVCAPDFLARHDRFLSPLRAEPGFARLLERARAASEALREAIAREPPLELPA